MANQLLERAAHQRPANTKRGVLERLFTLMFQGFVYNQIWEDPDVDLQALDLKPHHRLITIASGGCNVLNYLAADPAKIIAVDLNPNHVALTRLKLAALANLPGYEDFFRFFGQANDKANRAAYDISSPTKLDRETRHYWEKQSCCTAGASTCSRAISIATGCSGRFIGILHAVAKLHGKKLENMLEARTLAEQRAAFDRLIAPMFDYRSVRLLSKRPVSLYALGIPPAQYDELVGTGGNAIAVLRERVERLACDFPDPRKLLRLAGLRAQLRSGEPRSRARLSAGRDLRENPSTDGSGGGASRLAHRFPRPPGRPLDPPLRAARQPGLDEPRPARLAVGGDRPHRRCRRTHASSSARPAPIRPCRASCRRNCWRRGVISRRKAAPSTPETVPRSMAGSTSMSGAR